MRLQIIFSTLFITVSFGIISTKSSQANAEGVVKPSVLSQGITIPSKNAPCKQRRIKGAISGCTWAADDVEVSRLIRKRAKKKSAMQGREQMRKRARAKALEAEVISSNIRSTKSQEDEMQKSEETPNNMNELSVGKLNIIDPDYDTQPQATPQLEIIIPNLKLPKVHITR
jgi:hypothetical protein